MRVTAQRPPKQKSRRHRRRSLSTLRTRTSRQSTWTRSWASATDMHGRLTDIIGGSTARPIMPDGMIRGSMEEGSMIHGFMTRIGMEDGTAVHIGQDGMTRGTARGEIHGTTITIGTTTIITTTTTIITTTIRSSMDRVMLTEATAFISDQEEVKAECQGDMGQALLYAAAPQQCAVLLPQGKQALRGAALQAG